jgi:hypothetical protein
MKEAKEAVCSVPSAQWSSSTRRRAGVNGRGQRRAPKRTWSKVFVGLIYQQSVTTGTKHIKCQMGSLPSRGLHSSRETDDACRKMVTQAQG